MTTIEQHDELGEILTMARDSGIDPNVILRHDLDASYRAGLNLPNFVASLEKAGALGRVFAKEFRIKYGLDQAHEEKHADA